MTEHDPSSIVEFLNLMDYRDWDAELPILLMRAEKS